MKTKILIMAFMLSCVVNSYAQVDSLEFFQTIDSINACLEQLKDKNDSLATVNMSLDKKIYSLDTQIQQLEKEVVMQKDKSESLDSAIKSNTMAISACNSTLGAEIESANSNIAAHSQNLMHKTIWGAIIALLVFLASALIAFLLHRNGNSKIEVLKKQSEKISEEIITKLSNELEEIKKLSSSIESLSASGKSSQDGSDLIKALADRITFIEMTLYRMDHSVRGYKHLLKALSQMKDNLMANGYEIVDMLGKPYQEGTKAIVNFNDDETLEKGQRIITGITKPQINYQGKMIQTAQITVSQNI